MKEHFIRCYCLKTINFPDDSKSKYIQSIAFSESAIEKIGITSHVISLGDCVFKGCKKLKKVFFFY